MTNMKIKLLYKLLINIIFNLRKIMLSLTKKFNLNLCGKINNYKKEI